MKVPNIFNGLTELASKAKRTDANPAAAVGASAAAASAAPPSATASMREIVARYDMTDITPNDFSTMIQQLYAKGAISSKDMHDLSSIRAELDSAGVGADQSVNLQEFYQQRIAKAKVDAAQADDPAAAHTNIQSLAARMTWIERFTAVRQGDNAAGVNAVA